MSFLNKYSIRGMSIFFLYVLLNFSFVFEVAAQIRSQSLNNQYTVREIIDSGHNFFGEISGGLATAIEKIFQKYGLPNGYLLGEEGSGAFLGGLTYGEGALYTKNIGVHKIFWQGPSIGWDFGCQGSRVMILVYHLDNIGNIEGRYGGISGSAYFVAGLGFHVLKRNNILLVPIRTGIGIKFGISAGYLKLTLNPTWNPF
ncbi:MAG: Heme exporter protein D [Candidatus Tokpelaia sp. JSC188]|nr:MAG: Heme exporter protein D [Candidatus Tokpelaia sp. JSC188]